MDISSLIVYVKAEDVHKNIAEDVETRFETSTIELGRPLLKQKLTRSMKDE